MTAMSRHLDSVSISRPSLSLKTFRGLANGIIDLVFEQDGRYYLADFKSNYLGPELSDYAADALKHHLLAQYYDVQYLIYTVALHRYLQSVLADYDYDQHFGGIVYLYLRGLRPDLPGNGVFFHRLSRDTVDHLSDHVFPPMVPRRAV